MIWVLIVAGLIVGSVNVTDIQERRRGKSAARRKWIWHRISYWGDKLLTLTFYLLVGVSIIAYKLTIKGKNGLITLLKRGWGGIQTYRDAKRHKRDYKEYGIVIPRDVK